MSHSYSLLYALVIEDDADIRAVIQFSLESMTGWQVNAITSHQSWLTTLQAQLPDIIVLDMDSQGADVLFQLKAMDEVAQVPVVYLVARDRLADREQAQQAGAVAVVPKPFDPTALVQVLVEAVEANRLD